MESILDFTALFPLKIFITKGKSATSPVFSSRVSYLFVFCYIVFFKNSLYDKIKVTTLKIIDFLSNFPFFFFLLLSLMLFWEESYNVPGFYVAILFSFNIPHLLV